MTGKSEMNLELGLIPVQHLPSEINLQFDTYTQRQMEKNYKEMHGPQLVGRHRVIDDAGRVDIEATAHSVGAILQVRNLSAKKQHGNLTASPEGTGWVITTDKGQSPAEWAFTIGHEIGHIMLFGWAEYRGMQLGRTKEYQSAFLRKVRTDNEYYRRVEALCDYVSCKILGYVE